MSYSLPNLLRRCLITTLLYFPKNNNLSVCNTKTKKLILHRPVGVGFYSIFWNGLTMKFLIASYDALSNLSPGTSKFIYERHGKKTEKQQFFIVKVSIVIWLLGSVSQQKGSVSQQKQNNNL